MLNWRISHTPENSNSNSKQSVTFTNKNLTSIPEFWAEKPKAEKVNLSNNPISSISKLPKLKYLRTLNLDNTSIATLQGANELPNLEEITFTGSPLANTTFCHLMCLSIYPNLKKVNNIYISKKDTAFIEKNRAIISKYALEGYNLMSIGNSRRKSNINNNESFQVDEIAMKFINPETRKRKVFYDSIRLSFLGQTSIKSIPASLNNPKYANLEILILSGTSISDLSGLPPLMNLRSLQLDNSQFTTLANCFAEQPKLESLSYSKTPFEEYIKYNQEMSLIVFPTLKNINKAPVAEKVIENVKSISEKEKFPRDKIVKRGLVVNEIKDGVKFMNFDPVTKVIYDENENVSKNSNISIMDYEDFSSPSEDLKNKQSTFKAKRQELDEKEYEEEEYESNSIKNHNNEEEAEIFVEFDENSGKNQLENDEDSQVNDEVFSVNDEKPKDLNQNSSSEKSYKKKAPKRKIETTSDIELSDELEQINKKAEKRPQAHSQVSKPKRNSRRKSSKSDDENNDDYDYEENPKLSGTKNKRPKASSVVSSSKKDKKKAAKNKKAFDYSADSASEKSEEDLPQPLLLRKSNKSKLDYGKNRKSKKANRRTIEDDHKSGFDSFSDNNDYSYEEEVERNIDHDYSDGDQIDSTTKRDSEKKSVKNKNKKLNKKAIKDDHKSGFDSFSDNNDYSYEEKVERNIDHDYSDGDQIDSTAKRDSEKKSVKGKNKRSSKFGYSSDSNDENSDDDFSDISNRKSKKKDSRKKKPAAKVEKKQTKKISFDESSENSNDESDNSDKFIKRYIKDSKKSKESSPKHKTDLKLEGSDDSYNNSEKVTKKYSKGKNKFDYSDED